MTSHRLVFALAIVGMVSGTTMAAQAPPPQQQQYAVVIEAAPIYLLPDATRTPLRTAAVNMQLRVLADKGDWLQVEFNDPQFGRRVGYIAKNKVRIIRNEMPPSDQTIRKPVAQPQIRSNRWNPEQLGIKGYGTYGTTAFAASDTFDAIAGSSTFANLGGGVTVTNIWRRVFVDVGISQTELDGQRIFVDNGTVFELGIPLNVTVTPIDAAAGWRASSGRLSTFLGAGVTSLSYKETGGFAADGENLTKRRSGPLLLVGIDVALTRWMQVGGELRYRAVKGILGEDGASEAFNEDQIGGMSAGVRVSVGK